MHRKIVLALLTGAGILLALLAALVGWMPNREASSDSVASP